MPRPSQHDIPFAPLSREFYLPTADAVAPALLGHYLLRRTAQGLAGGVIVEAEAYLTDDPACHAYKRQTARNAAMWGEPGTAYVYVIYGCHFCVNAVCRPTGSAEAVLIRAVEPVFGLDLMQERRPDAQPRNLTSGPARLCAALDIDRALDGIDLCDAGSPLTIAANPQAQEYRAAHGPLLATARIGITQAADWPLRFLLAGSKFLSRQAPRDPASR